MLISTLPGTNAGAIIETENGTTYDVTISDHVDFNISSSDSNAATVSDIQVTNNAGRPIVISNIQATAEAGYTLNQFSSNFNTYAADSGHFGIAYTTRSSSGEDISGTGLNLRRPIMSGVSKDFSFAGKSSVYSTEYTSNNPHLASIVLTVDINEEDNTNSALCSNEELQKWNYTLNNDGTVMLHYYMGTNNNGTYVADENVKVCGSYEANDTVYDTVIDSNTSTSSSTPYMFNAKDLTQNANIVSIYFDKGVNMSSTAGISYMFYGASSLTSLDVGNLDTSNVTTMRSTFSEASSLTNLDVSNFDTSKVTDMSFMFNGASSLASLDLGSFDTSNVTTMRAMFQRTSSLTNLNVSNFNTSNVTNMQYMFSGASSLTSLDLSSFDTSNVTTMKAMFRIVPSLTNLNLSGFNTSKVTDMSYMFTLASSLTSLDLRSFDTANVTTMRSMFSTGESHAGNGKISEILGLEGFKTSNVTDMTGMFYGNGQMTSYNISDWDVSKVESFNHMFCDNFKLTSLDLSGWNVSNVKTMYDMFDDASSLTTIGDISRWNTASLIDVGGFLNGASSFIGDNGTLDLSGWNTANLKVTGEMFRATKLHYINLTGWTFNSITNDAWDGAGSGIYYETGNTSSYKGMAGMFLNMPNLEHVYISEDVSIPVGVDVHDMWGGTTPISDFTVVPNA